MIISYKDKATGQIITKDTWGLSRKNISFFKYTCCNRNVDLLYLDAQDILSSDVSKRYTTRYIPKANGTFRRIDVPDEELKRYMNRVKRWITKDINFLFPECIGAYVKGRSPKQAAMVHAGACAIAKFDIKDFFRSVNLEFIMKSLSQIYPFGLMDEEVLKTIIKACMIEYDDRFRLPQGAPTSPLLSNLAMIPIDRQLFNYRKLERCTYSRYADDLFFSFGFNATQMTFNSLERFVQSKLPICLRLNEDKTKFKNLKHGNVRMLGISVGNTVKIGSHNKQYLKAMIWTFLKDAKEGNLWLEPQVLELMGKVNYYKYIEPRFVYEIINKYESKLNLKISYDELVKNILSSRE